MKKSLLFILTGVLVVMAITGASYYVLTQFNPNLEIRRMMIAMAGLETIRQDAGFSWTRVVDDERVNTTLYAAGQLNIEETTAIEHGTSFRVVHLGESDEYNDLSGELRIIAELTYLTYTPPGPEVSGVSFDESQSWVSFEAGELPEWGSILPGLDLPIEHERSSESWTPEGIERLRYLLAFADIMTSEYDGLTEVIHEVETNIIDARFDEFAMQAFLLDLIRAKEDRDPSDEERILAAGQAKQISRLTLRLWIGIKDHLLYRVQAAGGFTEEGSTALTPVDVRIEFSDFNEPFEVEAPTETITFARILQSAFANLPSATEADAASLRGDNSTLVSDDAARLPVEEVNSNNDVDNDGLDSILEGFYGTDPNNPDTDGDGVSDGDEVRSGRNPRGSGSLFGFGLD